MKTKGLKKSIARIVILAVFLSAFVGCRGGASLKKNGEGIELLKNPIVIAESSTAYYTLVKPQNATDLINECVHSLSSLGSGSSFSTDIAREADNESVKKEILIGNTCRNESKEALARIGFDDFSVTCTENKIVVAAHTPERLAEAVAFLKEKLIKNNDGRLEYVGNYTFTSAESLMIGEGESLADYKIVCGDPDSLYVAASNLKKALKNAYGVDLEIIFDSTSKTGKEIVVGNAEREIAGKTDALRMGEGIIAVENGDLLIAAADVTTSLETVKLFLSEYLTGIYTDVFNFKASFSRIENMHAEFFMDPSGMAEGSELRVMSFNVLCELYNDKPAISGRDLKVASVIMQYAPDVMGLQELSPKWHRSLEALLKGTPYKMIGKQNTVTHATYGDINFTPIIYNSQTVTPIASGVEAFSVASKTFAYVMTWGYFEKNDGGQRFVVINTHFDLRDQGEDKTHDNNRTQQAKELAAFINVLKERYGCPVIATGDYNTMESESRYHTILNEAQMHEAKHTAERIRRKCATYHKLGSMISTVNADSHDHILGSEEVSFLYYNVLVDTHVIQASDHCPIYADLKFF